MSNDVSVGEAIVPLLEGYGVDTVFGIPGVHNVELYRALPRSRIRHVLPRHEQGAGFMADGYARVTGKPGVCFTITGPGLTNILTPMGQAYSDSTPMLVLASALDIADGAHGRGRLHEMQSQCAAAASVASSARVAATAGDVQDLIAEAFAGFSAARPRPAYVELPMDLLKQPAGPDWSARALPKRPEAAGSLCQQAAKLLSRARRPALLIGGGARHAGDAAMAIAETTGAIVFLTVAAKGAAPSAHPLNAGALLPNAGALKLLSEADVVLAAGTEFSETDLWAEGYRFDGELIRIDIDPANLVRPHPPTLPILADAAGALQQIAGTLTGAKADCDPARARVADLRAELAGNADSLRTMLTDVLETIRDALPVDTAIASDMTQIAYAANEVFHTEQPDCWLHPVGFGTLGYALPAAIGAKAGLGERPVAAMAGDYGLQYTINELATAAEHGMALPVLLWNNNALAQIRDDMVMKGIQPNAVTLKNPDFQALAKAYGCGAEKPAGHGALKAAIAAALTAERPVVIEMDADMARRS